jgi:CheY-like chemotaxis protein
VAKILVADDNSNIQKMVGLALKDQGIDVVAVGNGEAAVRKISDVKPDLVLADVFMPVRNGYEVCQYVKTDAALAHIPVILLVGAFDPLDEQEAQRVGADGVLKKPFVPPDPLISMVKSALTRAGVSYSGAGPGKETAPEPLRATDLLTPRAPASIMGAVPTMFGASTSSAESEAQEAAAEEVSARPEPVKMESGAPLAFGSLLETPASTEEDDAAFVSTARPEVERDWNAGHQEEETEEEEEEEKPGWRRDGGDETFVDAGVDTGTAGAVKDWRDTIMTDITSRKSARETWEPTKEKTEIVEAAEAPTLAASSTSFVTETPVTEMPVVVPPLVLPEKPFGTDAWAAVDAGTPGQKLGPIPVEETRPANVEQAAGTKGFGGERVSDMPTAASSDRAPTVGGWFSTTSSPWDAEAKKATELASSWDSAVATHPAPHATDPVPTQEDVAAAVGAVQEAAAAEAPVYSGEPLVEGEATREVLETAALPTEAVEEIRERAAYVAETVQNSPDAAASSSTTAPSVAPEPNMDELVAKVLAKMSPEALQAVTREILKPVIETIIRDELKSKKQ